jgi:hypothetical protein
MALTTAQLQTLKTAIAAETDPAFVEYRNQGATGAMAGWYNTTASPSFTVWKTSVPLSDVAANVDGVELVGLTSVKLAAYQSLLLAGSVNPSKDRLRAGFDQVFSAAGGATTRPLLLALWKRLATRGEKLYATGTGSDATPAYLTFEGSISDYDVVQATTQV